MAIAWISYFEPCLSETIFNAPLIPKTFPTIISGALRAPAFGCFCAASHLDSLSVDKGICYLAPGIMQVPPCGFAGDPQSFCRLFLFKAFEIDETDQFNLLRFERDAFVLFTKVAAGFVTSGLPGSFNNTPDARPSPPGAWEHFWFFAVRHPSISCDQSFS
jgi:hypothetical protein